MDSSNRVLEGIEKDGTKYIAGDLKIDGDIINQGINNKFDGKIDKEDNKSLIDADFAISNYAIDNQEFIKVELDSSNHVLEGINSNGVKQINIPIETPAYNQYVIDNPEYIKVELDNDNKIINAIKRNGDVIIGGVNINELKLSVDSNIIAIEYDASTYSIYAITGEDSNVSLSMDEDGHIYKETIIEK